MIRYNEVWLVLLYIIKVPIVNYLSVLLNFDYRSIRSNFRLKPSLLLFGFSEFRVGEKDKNN